MLSLLGTEWGIKCSITREAAPHLPWIVGILPGAESGFKPNTVSGTLILLVPVQICLVLGLMAEPAMTNTRWRWLVLLAGLCLVPTALVILLAQSRAARAALAVGLVSLVGMVARRPDLTTVAVIAGVLALLVMLGPIGLGEWLVGQDWMTNSTAGSWAARAEVWSRAIWASAEFPLTGVGMDIFRRSAWEMYPFLHWPFGEDLGHAHNIVLQVALDLGLPGAISYLAFLGGTLGLGWWSYRSSPCRRSQLLALGGLVGLATHTAWSLVDALPLGARTSFLWWTVAAVVMTVATVDVQTTERGQMLSRSAGHSEPLGHQSASKATTANDPRST